MKRSLNFLFFGLVFLILAAIWFFSRSDLNKQLENDMQWALNKYHLAGISVSYTLGKPSSTKTLVAGYANVATKLAITPDSYFEVGSITKAFVSSIIMQQVALGKISLDETLAKVVKRYPDKNDQLADLVKKYPHLGVITLREYLTHTSGVAQSINTKTFINAFNQNPMGYWSSKALVSIAMQHKPYFSPGEKGYYGYTNTDYCVMGLVIEALTGKTIADAMGGFISQLGLKHIYFPSPRSKNISKEVKNRMAHAYVTKQSQTYNLKAFSRSPQVVFSDGTIAKDITPIAINYASIGAASGGIIAQVPDLVKWYWLLFHDKVMPEKNFSEMLKGVTTADPNKKYGLAVVVQQTKQYGVIYSHDGDVFGYDANLLYVPKLNLVLAVAVNTSTGAVSPTVHDIVGKLLQTFAKKNLGREYKCCEKEPYRL